MGFAAGSEPAHHIAQAIRKDVTGLTGMAPSTADAVRFRLYDAIIKAFEEIDCDTLEEVVDCYGFDDPQWAAAMKANGYVDFDDEVSDEESPDLERRLVSLIQAVDGYDALDDFGNLTPEQRETLEMVRSIGRGSHEED